MTFACLPQNKTFEVSTALLKVAAQLSVRTNLSNCKIKCQHYCLSCVSVVITVVFPEEVPRTVHA